MHPHCVVWEGEIVLDYPLSEHGMSHFHEAGYIGTFHVIDVAVALFAVFHALLVYVVHYFMQPVVNFFF